MGHLPLDEVIEAALGRSEKPNSEKAKKSPVDTASTGDKFPVEEVREVPKMETSAKEHRPTFCGETAELDTKRKSDAKKFSVTARLTEQERKKFQERVRDSGLPQGIFVKKAILNSKVVAEKIEIGDAEMLDCIAMLRAELRQVNSKLKIIIEDSAEQKKIHPEEWYRVIAIVLELEAARTRLSELERRLLYGAH